MKEKEERGPGRLRGGWRESSLRQAPNPATRPPPAATMPLRVSPYPPRPQPKSLAHISDPDSWPLHQDEPLNPLGPLPGWPLSNGTNTSLARTLPFNSQPTISLMLLNR